MAPTILACDHVVDLLSRKILLSGSNNNYLYADSLFVFNRLSASIRQQLLTTDKPIGLMWKEERLETYREIIDSRVEICAEAASHFGLSASSPFASRTYVIYRLGKPLGTITEKWPLTMFSEMIPSVEPPTLQTHGLEPR
jgi:chorismate-pyruvate lyase